MNKKLIIKDTSGKYKYCILSSQEPFDDQLNKVFRIDMSACFHPVAELGEKYIVIKDNRTLETLAQLEIISFNDTDESVSLKWILKSE